MCNPAEQGKKKAKKREQDDDLVVRKGNIELFESKLLLFFLNILGY